MSKYEKYMITTVAVSEQQLISDTAGGLAVAWWVPDDDELSVLGALLDVVGHNRHVLEVKGRIDLVHHVQRRRLHTTTTIEKTLNRV